jgi:hypothetical protein
MRELDQRCSTRQTVPITSQWKKKNYLNQSAMKYVYGMSVGINRSKYCWLVGFSYNIEKNVAVKNRAL